VTGIDQGVSEVRADREPIAATEDIHPSCPICGSRQTKFLCAVDHYRVWRCPSSAVDFVHPVPTMETLDALYDRPEWFEGGERGGYVSYDTQTDASPLWLVELLDRLAAERSSPSILDIGCAYGTHLGLAKDKGGSHLASNRRNTPERRPADVIRVYTWPRQSRKFRPIVLI
jgi:hypothetical protein